MTLNLLKFKTLLTLFCLGSLPALSQDHVFSFGLSGPMGTEISYTTVQDDAHNVYIGGTFSGTIDFDPSGNTANLVCPMAPCGCMAKYDSLGNLVWANILASNFAPTEVHSLKIDNNGDLVATGWFMDSTDFDPSPNVAKLGAVGAHDVFIAKYDDAGNYIWAKSFGGPAPDYSFSMDIDKNDNIVIAGYFIGTADFDPSANTANLSGVMGSPDVFVAKYDPLGNYIWAKSFGGNNQDEGAAVAVDTSGNIYVTGYFQNSGDFDPGAGVTTLTSQGLRDAFLSKFDDSGNFQWAFALGDAGDEMGRSISVSEAGNVYLTGTFGATVDFDPSSAGTVQHTSAGSEDIFIAGYDNAGNYLWAQPIGGTDTDVSTGIKFDNNYVYLTGYFSGSPDFDPGPNTATITSQGGEDMFMAKYDAMGTYVWAEGIGGTGNDRALDIVIETSQNLYITGSFESTVDFDPSVGTANATASNATDMFLAKYNFCMPDTTVVDTNLCDGESILFGGQTISAAGTYYDVVQSVMGCDSVVELTVSVTTLTATISQVDNTTLQATASPGTYQWIDCDSNTPLAGETTLTLVVPASGNYAIMVASANGCVDTSACFYIDTLDVGIGENVAELLELYPNPANNTINIQVNKNTAMVIYSVSGKAVRTHYLQQGLNRVDVSALPAGSYYIRTDYNGYVPFIILK